MKGVNILDTSWHRESDHALLVVVTCYFFLIVIYLRTTESPLSVLGCMVKTCSCR